MTNRWQTKRLGDFALAVSTGPFGSILHKSDYVDDGVPLVNPINIVGESIVPDQSKLISNGTIRRLSKYVLEEGDVVIGRRGEIGRCAVVGPDEKGWVCGTGSFFIRPLPALDSQFLAHLIRSNGYRKKLEQLSTGTTMKNLSNTALGDLVISVPPLSDQQRIVCILDEAFEGIATAKANAEKNLQNARALFESHLQSVFTQRGEGWVEKKLSDVCAITSTLVDPRKKDFLDLIHVGAGNIESKTGIFFGLKSAREEGLISGKFLFDESMVLYSKIRPYLMKVARPDFNGLCSADMYPLAPLPNEITRDYLFHLLLSKCFTNYAIQGSARAGMPKVNREHLFEFRVWLPSVKKQNELAAKLDALHEETQRLEALYQRKLAALEALKKSLLHQALTGQLAVDKGQFAMEAAFHG
jgi:type I restriction enzyme, S subunit